MKPDNLIGQKYGRLTVLERDFNYVVEHKIKTKRTYWKCQCDCGNILTVRGSHLKNGTTKSCGCLIKDTRIPNLVNQKFGKLLVLELTNERDEYRNVKWKCQCECGRITYPTTNHLLRGLSQSCGNCNKSLGENKIFCLLKENNISFEKQKTFQTCRFPDTNNLGFFDFYINNTFLLEFDGEQHFHTKNHGWDNEANFLKTKQHDLYKNQWCKENNIPLKRIPYWELKNLTIEDIMGDKFLLKEIKEKNE